MSVSNAWKLDPYLQQIIHDGITLDEDEHKHINKKLQEVFHETLLREMKDSDPVFERLFRELHYGGSFYENLKVKECNEFDINVELCLPISKDLIEIVPSYDVPGFAEVHVSPLIFPPSLDDSIKSCISDWFDEDNNLQRTKIVSWMQSVVDSALDNADMPEEIEVESCMSGPAITLRVNAYGKKFSIDLVPVFGFHVSRWPPPPFRQRDEVPHGEYLFQVPWKFGGNYLPQFKTTWPYNRKKWFVVPKSPGTFSQFPSLWRLSFYNQEKELMKELGNMTPVLKLLKKLRDILNWKGLSSYYLKTIFMWEQTKHHNSFWYQGLGSLYLYMLEKVEATLHTGRIDFFWDERLNLLKDIPKDFIKNTKNCIANIRRKIISHLNDDHSEFIHQVYDGEL